MSTDAAIDRAVAALRAGALVAFPTETVYGLGADALDPVAVGRIFAVKGRPADHPLIVHLAGADALDGWATRVPPGARRLAEACWPGPLTLVLPRRSRVPDAVTGGRDSVGLRVPAHPVALALLARFGSGVAAPSANRFGRVSPTTAEHVRTDLGAWLGPGDVILDGGHVDVGVESTIIDLCTDVPVLLRAGGLAVETVEEVLGRPAERHAVGPARAPGMLPSHYAPRCALTLVDDAGGVDEALAGARATGRHVDAWVPGDDLAGVARELYDRLRAADRAGLDELVVVRVPDRGLGVAINDRLAKAAAPRPLEPEGT